MTVISSLLLLRNASSKTEEGRKGETEAETERKTDKQTGIRQTDRQTRGTFSTIMDQDVGLSS